MLPEDLASHWLDGTPCYQRYIHGAKVPCSTSTTHVECIRSLFQRNSVAETIQHDSSGYGDPHSARRTDADGHQHLLQQCQETGPLAPI